MKKIINEPRHVLSDALMGMSHAHANKVIIDNAKRLVFRKKEKPQGCVALISGGGSGHEPMHGGFVGEGMLDAACMGEIFTSPTPDQMIEATERVNRDAGVIYIVKNYAGDVMNFEMASDMSDCDVDIVLVDDDVALHGVETGSEQGSRGVAGTLVVEKLMGAMSERDGTLKKCAKLGRSVNTATGSMAIATESCVVPAIGSPTFSLEADQMEVGVGIHGEAGRETRTLQSADQIAGTLVHSILEKLKPSKTDPLLLFCNGLGATPLVELYVLYNAAFNILDAQGYTVVRSLVGPYCTALDMAGASLTITKMEPEWVDLWDDPVRTISLNW